MLAFWTCTWLIGWTICPGTDAFASYRPFSRPRSSLALSSADLNLAPNSGDGALDFDPTPPDGTAVVGQSISGSGSQDVNALFYSQFAGGGTFDLAIDVSQVVDFGQSNGVEFAFAPVQAGGSVTITINLVPEPSVGLLSMIGIWLLAMRRRRP